MYNNFNKFIQNNNLIDLEYIVILFTWYNKRENENAVFVRLDSALANYRWLNLFPNVILNNLPIFGSDKAPTFINPSISTLNNSYCRFNSKQHGYFKRFI